MVSERRSLILEIAKEHGLSEAEVTRVVSSQFRLLAETISRGKNENVRLPGLGVFRTNPKRIAYLKKEKDAKRRLTEGN